jgi:CelD/BcsL family acetyltransferase involved in cellulose biosynthesis
MNVVTLRPQFAGHEPVRAVAGHIARVEVCDDMAQVESYWRTLERAHALATPYQRFDFLSLWQRHIGAKTGVTPFIVIGFDAVGAPLFLLPLGVRAFGPWSVIEFLGGRHVNFNMGVWRRELAAGLTAGDLRAVLKSLCGSADFMMLRNQSLTWGGATNPFALLRHQRAANRGFSGALIADFEALLRTCTNSAARKKMRKKERALAAFGEVHFERANDPAAVHRVLDAFFKQKNARMRAIGFADVFAAAEVRRFVEAAATTRLADGEPLIELYSLSVNNIIVATMGGTVGNGRFCGMFNSIIDGRHAVESPGEQLLLNLVKRCCERGFTAIDLGIGEARYKGLFCGDLEPLFDSFLPLSHTGHVLAPLAALAERIKCTIKQRPMLWSLVCAARRMRARMSAPH